MNATLGGMAFGILLTLFFVKWYHEAKDREEKPEQTTAPERTETMSCNPSPATEQLIDAREMRYAVVAAKIERLYALKQELDEAEGMISELQSCSPERLSENFRVKFTTATGKEKQIDFMAHGEDDVDTQNLYQLAEGKRHKLRTSLLNQISELYDNVVTKTVTKTIE